jgi:hypothetical protein
MTLSAEERDMLIDFLRELTPGHVSTLVASLSEPGSQIGTSTDSKNYVFLQKLCELGLAKEVPLELDLPPEIQTVLTSFLIDEEAKAEIADLLRGWRTGEGGFDE